MSEEYVKPSENDILLDNDATKRTLTSLYETLSQHGVDVSQIKANIADACGKIMQVQGPLIEIAWSTAGRRLEKGIDSPEDGPPLTTCQPIGQPYVQAQIERLLLLGGSPVTMARPAARDNQGLHR